MAKTAQKVAAARAASIKKKTVTFSCKKAFSSAEKTNTNSRPDTLHALPAKHDKKSQNKHDKHDKHDEDIVDVSDALSPSSPPPSLPSSTQSSPNESSIDSTFQMATKAAAHCDLEAPLSENADSSNDDDDESMHDAVGEDAVDEDAVDEDAESANGENQSDGCGDNRNTNLQQTKRSQLKKKKRRNAIAKCRGYRALAVQSGVAPRAMLANILNLNEVIRACKWRPQCPDAIAFDSNMEEFNERMSLVSEPLPKSVATVFQHSAELFARHVVNEAVQRTLFEGKTRVSAATMASVLHPFERALRFSFAAPTGLVRHAQATVVGSEGARAPAIPTLLEDEDQCEAEAIAVQKQLEVQEQFLRALAWKKQLRNANIKAKKKK